MGRDGGGADRGRAPGADWHRLIGIVFFSQQTLVALAYVARRPAR